MSTITDWKQCYAAVATLAHQFNAEVRKLDPDQVDRTYSIAKAEVEKLTELQYSLAKRRDALKNRSYHFASSLEGELAVTHRMNMLFVALSIVGFSYPKAHRGAEWTGLALFIIGQLGNASALVYTQFLGELQAEARHLAELDETELTKAKIFADFIAKFKEVETLEEQVEKTPFAAEEIKEELPSSSNAESPSTRSRIDSSIADCLKEYDKLPDDLKQDEAYCLMVSRFIQKLPKNDPLWQSLMNMETETQLGLKKDKDQEKNSLESNTQYYTKITRQGSSSSDSPPKNSLKGEGAAKSDFHRTHSFSFMVEEERPADRVPSFEEYQAMLVKRFGISHKPLFIQTPAGVKLTGQDAPKTVTASAARSNEEIGSEDGSLKYSESNNNSLKQPVVGEVIAPVDIELLPV